MKCTVEKWLVAGWCVGFAGLATLWLLGIPTSTDAESPGGIQLADQTQVVSWRLETYRELLLSLYANIRLQAVTAFIGAAVILRRRQSNGQPVDEHLPVLDISIPPIALHVLIPVVLLVLWFQFGYMMNALIHQRLDLFAILDNDLTGIDKKLNAARALNDGGFLDAWFRAFHPHEIDTHVNSTAGVIGNGVALFLVYGGLLGASHAVLLGLLYFRRVDILAMRPDGEEVPPSVLRQANWFLVATVVAGVVLMGTHYQFCIAGGNHNWQQACTGLMALGLLRMLWAARRAVAG